MEDYAVIGAVAAMVVLAVLAVWMFTARRRRTNLQERFGHEYHRAVGSTGSAAAAETALLEREKRVRKYKVRALTTDERGRFTNLWQRVQAQFVDDPSTAVVEADVLVTELMTTRGYPMSDWEHRVEDLTVDHPAVVNHYRQARDISRRQVDGGTTTEDLRQALVHYRALFTDLLDDASSPKR